MHCNDFLFSNSAPVIATAYLKQLLFVCDSKKEEVWKDCVFLHSKRRAVRDKSNNVLLNTINTIQNIFLAK